MARPAMCHVGGCATERPATPKQGRPASLREFIRGRKRQMRNRYRGIACAALMLLAAGCSAPVRKKDVPVFVPPSPELPRIQYLTSFSGLKDVEEQSSFERFVGSQSSERMKLRQTSLEECRRTVARGLRVTKELGMPVPFDFGLGRPLLGDVERDVEAIGNPFQCVRCGAALDEETVAKIRELAPYDNMTPETRCAACRETPAKT